MKWAQILLLVWQLSLPTCGVLAFVCPASTRGISTATITSTLGLSPLDGGTSGESNEKAEKKRMEMVRKLQKTFYKPTDGSSGDEEPQPRLDEESGIVTDLPLWRVGWIETPGRSNCLNVHEGQYTNMFEKILSGPKPWYVGHLHLPGGFKMTRTDEERFNLKTWRDELDDVNRFEESERSAVVGCLMRITDYRRTVDGRLILLVHAMERFVVERVVQHFPYSVADCQILPDTEDIVNGADENFTKRSRAVAVKTSFEYHNYEYDEINLPLPGDVEYLPPEGIPAGDIAKVLPFAYYSTDDMSLEKIKKAPEISSSGFLGGEPTLEQQLKNGGVLRDPAFIPGPKAENRRTTDINVLETLLWLELDDFCRNTGFVLPEEILGLMPRGLDYLHMDPPKRRLSEKYPVVRRQRRLSYLAPVLLENIEIGAGMRQDWLDTPSTQARLGAVLERYEFINDSMTSRLGEFE